MPIEFFSYKIMKNPPDMTNHVLFLKMSL